MGLASFNRARRLAAETENEPVDEADALRARLTRLGVKFHHKAGADKLRDLLNAALDDDTHGLTRREINADLENLKVEFDPDAPRDDLLRLLEQAKSEAAAEPVDEADAESAGA